MKLHMKQTKILQRSHENMLEVPNPDLTRKHVERLIKYIEMRYDHVPKWDMPTV
jgi:hypothetical protein